MTNVRVAIALCDATSADARAMSDALWDEVQGRYGFVAGFTPIPSFGKWTGDETARCFEKSLG